jgi:hypothetical protein
MRRWTTLHLHKLDAAAPDNATLIDLAKEIVGRR